MVLRPDEIQREPPGPNARLWQWAGVKRPAGGDSVGMTQLADALGGLFKRMATLEGRQDVVGFGVGQQLRREYSLGVGRGHEEIPFSASEAVRESRNPDTPAWDPPDAWSMKGYDNVEILPVLEPVLNEAPPSQREAAEIYLEASAQGVTWTNWPASTASSP